MALAGAEAAAGGLRRAWARRYSPAGVRIGIGCAVAAGVALSQVGGGATGADTAFVPGTGSAQAHAISFAPTTGGLNYAITLATSISQFQNNEAQSLSQTIDLGAIGTALEAETCDNSPPVVPKKDVPPPVQAESINGNQTLTDSITPSSTSTGIGVGTEQAEVTTQPSGSSTTTVTNIGVPGVLTVSGLTTNSHVEIQGGATRVAVATADVGAISLANGAIQIGGLHWTATHETGATKAATGTFSIGSLKVAGATVPLTLPQNPQSLLNIINTVGTPLGFNIQWPAMSALPDGTVVMSPLTIGIDNNVLGQEVVGSNLTSVQPVRSALVNALLKADCNLATPITVGDIGIGVLAGGGNLNLSLGGAQAITTDAASVSPFGSAGAPSLGTTAPIDAGLGASTLPSSSFSVPSVGTLPTVSSGAPTTTSSGGGPRESLGPIQRTTDCVSTSPAGGGCSSTNVAVPIGFIGLGLVFLLAAWDYVRQRRRARLIGQEVIA